MYKKVLIICFILTIAILAGCVPFTYTSRNDDVYKIIHERWTKEAYQKTKRKLTSIYVGMPYDNFTETMGFEAVTKGKHVVEVIADGLIRPLGGKVREDDGFVTEFVFGYVMRGLAVQKVVVQIRDDKIHNIINLETKDLGPIDMREVEVKDRKYFESKEGYHNTEEKLKNIAVGMNEREALIKLGCSFVATDGEFFLLAPGYLRNRYFHQEIGDKEIKEFYFGYVENKNEVIGFIIKTINNKVSEIIYQ